MAFRFAICMGILLAFAPVQAQAQAALPPSPPPAPATELVDIVTDKGTITVELDTVRAPVTSANFLRYADENRFGGTAFYRAMKLGFTDLPNGLIQGGTAGTNPRALPPIAHEPTSQTGILHTAGTISMARFAPGTATGDFFILLSDMPVLDANAAASDPNVGAGFAAFGHVVRGMEVVRAIHLAPVSPTEGEVGMKGQMLEPPVQIITVRRAAKPE